MRDVDTPSYGIGDRSATSVSGKAKGKQGDYKKIPTITKMAKAYRGRASSFLRGGVGDGDSSKFVLACFGRTAPCYMMSVKCI